MRIVSLRQTLCYLFFGILGLSSCAYTGISRTGESEDPASTDQSSTLPAQVEPVMQAPPATPEAAVASDESQDENSAEDRQGRQAMGEEPVQGPVEGLAQAYKAAPSNQQLIDSAMEYIQASNDFWERGDLDNSLDALDKAFSLILKMTGDMAPELLQQKEDLRVTIAKRIIEVYTSRYTAVNGQHKAIPLVMNEHVKKALDLFKGRERNFFLSAYRRSGRYRPAIVEAMKEAGLPEELSWLPLIESGFKVRALSRARALGPWQFIASTGYKFGLNRTEWVDERMDPEKSTTAAIAYLKELHQIFGDWTTVLAAYNCGELRVLNCIRRQQINFLDNFWDLYRQLPSETAFYVPKFLAVLHIVSDPAAHGFDLPPVDDELELEEVTMAKQVHLKNLAELLDVDFEEMRDCNPELRHNLTPDSPYQLKVPAGKGEILLAKMADIPVWQPPIPAYVVHRVRSGETLSTLAMRYRTTVRAIMRMNNLRNPRYLKIGWRLRIPTRGATSAQLAKLPAKSRIDITEYEVKKGDSLWKIARQFNTTTEIIRSLNQLDSNRLIVGQVLKLSESEKYSGESARTYRVRKGDSPFLIARRHGMKLADFLRLNGLTARSTIFPGQAVLVRN